MPTFPAFSLRAALRSPLLPYWLLIGLLPFGRSAEVATCLCLVGTGLLFARHPRALEDHAGARLLLWLLGGYIGAALISAVDSVAPGKSWATVAALSRFVPLGLYACFAIRRAEKLRAVYWAVAITVALWAVDAWMQAVAGLGLRGHSDPERLSGIFGAENLKLGPALSVLSPFVLWAARERWRQLGLLGAFVLLLGPILLSGSRASWLCYGLVGLAFAWREARAPGRFMVWCAAGAIILGLAGAVAWKTSSRFQARVEHTLVVFQGSNAALDTALTGRLDIWRTSLKMIEAHPVNGVGVRAYRYAYRQFAPPSDHFLTAETCGEGEGACHAHQLLLEILTETGVIGLFLWLAAAVLALRAWHRAGPAREAMFPASVALMAMLFPLNTHLAFYSAWWGLLFAWLLGLWCAALAVHGPWHSARVGDAA
ncbi:O-antigen ligase family protein [Dyella sp.]|uniref:O-antigen ligase family protein n=1 Tax=Dyella sp. TaxID=1869338 RepID=UPI002ED1B1BF